MSRLPAALQHLAVRLGRLPGVGERTALRLAFFVLEDGREAAQSLASALTNLHDGVRFCDRCHNLAAAALCGICDDPRRQKTSICVVESIPDLLAIEATATFHGSYHVLHGVLSPLRGIGPSELRIDSLIARVHDEHPEELIIAVAVSIEGEATATYLQRQLRGSDVQITRIASGVPQGAELEYLDAATLGRALQARVPM